MSTYSLGEKRALRNAGQTLIRGHSFQKVCNPGDETAVSLRACQYPRSRGRLPALYFYNPLDSMGGKWGLCFYFSGDAVFSL